MAWAPPINIFGILQDRYMLVHGCHFFAQNSNRLYAAHKVLTRVNSTRSGWSVTVTGGHLNVIRRLPAVLVITSRPPDVLDYWPPQPRDITNGGFRHGLYVRFLA